MSVCASKHRICTLPGDGIGPEIMSVATRLLKLAGDKEGVEFECSEHLIGGAAIEEHDNPYPEVTEKACKDSDAVLLAAIGGCTPPLPLPIQDMNKDATRTAVPGHDPLAVCRYKWDTRPAGSKPENGLLNMRASLNAYANLRPCLVLPQLAAASTLKPEVVSGVDIMIVRELVGGIYFGQPRVCSTS